MPAAPGNHPAATESATDAQPHADAGQPPTQAAPGNHPAATATAIDTQPHADAGPPSTPAASGSHPASTVTATDAQPHADAGQPPVCSGAPQNASPQEQAAQLSHNVEAIGLLAQETTPTKTHAPPKKPKKRKSNKVNFRADTEMLDRISEYARAAGLKESEAGRQLVEAGLGQPRVIITPKTPLADLELFVGALMAFIRILGSVKSRLNAPMPEGDDPKLVALVTKWRSVSAACLEEIPNFIEGARGFTAILTNLDSEKIRKLRWLHPTLQRWIQQYSDLIAKGGTPKEISNHESALENFRTLATLIEDLGILKGGC